MVSGDCQIAKPTIPIRNAEAMMALSPSAQPRKMLTLNRAVIKSSRLAGVTFILRPVVLADSRARVESIKAKGKRGGAPDKERHDQSAQMGHGRGSSSWKESEVPKKELCGSACALGMGR